MIDATAKVTDSTIADSARIYKNVIVRRSDIGVLDFEELLEVVVARGVAQKILP